MSPALSSLATKLLSLASSVKQSIVRISFVGATMGLAVLASASDPVRWSVTSTPGQSDGQLAVSIKADIDPGWHLYSLDKGTGDGPQATTIEPAPPLRFIGRIIQGTPIKKRDPNFGVDVSFFATSATFKATVVRPAASSKGSIRIRYQACDDRKCLPPKTVEIPIDGGTAAVMAVSTQTTQASKPVDQFSATVGEAKSKGLFAFIGLSFLAGLISLLTPCVFPMVPITVSYFTKRREKQKEGYAPIFAYVGGIVSSFAGFGVLVSILFGAGSIQRFATNPYVNLVLAAIFLLLAFSLFGMLSVTLPSRVVNRFSGASQKGGLLGPALMGLTFTLTSFTCTVPFMGTILAGASQGNYLYPLVGMLAYGTAFALPFFFLALFPQLLAKLPKSGSWLETTKAFMGFIEIAAAVKFLSNADLVLQLNLLSRPVFLGAWAVVATAAGFFLLGVLRLPKIDLPAKKGAIRIVTATMSIVGGLWLGSAIPGRSLGELEAFLPPSTTGWLTDFQTAKTLALKTNKPILVDFTGVTCTNCRWMEKNMFTRSQVAMEFEKYILVELYTDRQAESDVRNRGIEEQITGVDTLPAYVTLKPTGETIGIFQGSTRNPSEFLNFLKRRA